MTKIDNQLLARHLTQFIAVAEAGSLNKAAERLGVAQSALTRSLRQLEQNVGCQLFERGPRGALITPEGEVLLECAHRIRSEVNLAMMAISHISKTTAPRIRVGAVPSFGLGVLPAAVSAFQTAHRDVRVQVRQADAASLMALLVSSELDMYVGPLPGSETLPEIEIVPTPDVRALVYAKEEHPLASLATVDLKDLLPFRWVSLVQESGNVLPDNWRRTLTRFAYDNGAPPPNVVVETNSAMNALSITAKGDYLVCLSSLLLRDARIRGVANLPLSQPLTAHKIGIAFRSAIGRNAIARDLVTLIHEEAQNAANATR